MSLKNRDFWMGALAVDAGIDRVAASESRNVECERLYQAMQDTARTYLQDHSGAPIFKAGLLTEQGEPYELADLFVDQLPEDWKRDFRCYACLHFLRTWGALVCVHPSTGDLMPLFWKMDDSLPVQFHSSIEVVATTLRKSEIESSFNPPVDGVIGVAGVTKGFRQMHFKFSGAFGSNRRCLAGHTPASTLELAHMLGRVLQDNTQELVDRVAYLLIEDKLPYSDKHKGPIRWLQGLYNTERIMEKSERCQKNLIWHFAASSFVGCIHSLRSGAVSELLSWTMKEVSFDDIQGRWRALAGPCAYMRPIAAPKAGNILMAEKLFAELNLTQDDMRRAYLTPDQIPDSAFLYRAPTRPTPTLSVFGGVMPWTTPVTGATASKAGTDSLPSTAITFTRFAKEILPTARKVEYKLPEHDLVYFFITGIPDSAPLMQWHTPDNLASWYVYPRARPVKKYKLEAGWALVPYIVAYPNMWPDLVMLTSSKTAPDVTKHLYGSLPSDEQFASFKHKHHRIHYLVGMHGAQDDAAQLCLFPTLLKTELHGVRSTIEAYSNRGEVERQEVGKDAVAGVEIVKAEGQELDHLFRVTDWKGKIEIYKLVLW